MAEDWARQIEVDQHTAEPFFPSDRLWAGGSPAAGYLSCAAKKIEDFSGG